jgi:hypothetical protein
MSIDGRLRWLAARKRVIVEASLGISRIGQAYDLGEQEVEI